MIEIYANRQKSSNVRSGSRLSAARDRAAMAEIEAISDLYLARGMQKRDRKNKRYSPPSSSVSVTELTSSAKISAAPDTFERKLMSRLAERDETALLRRRQRTRSESTDFSVFHDLPTSAISPRWNAVSETLNENFERDELPNVHSRPATTNATLPIKRTPSRCTPSAQTLRCLQQKQQENRTKPDLNRSRHRNLRRSSSVPPPDKMSSRRGSRVLMPLATPITDFESFEESVTPTRAVTSNSTVECNAAISEKVQGFCNKVASNSDQPQWKKYDTKWSVVKNFVLSQKKANIDTPSPPAGQISVDTPPLSGERKPSVWWPNTLETYSKPVQQVLN
ncbi:uncharacterized protein LOC144744367 [Ciona intestinalis]